MRDRLPLLDDGELTGAERRTVERHLIACPDCRRRRVGLADALGVLRLAAADPVSPADAPSLWPSLQRQIRESRREPRPLRTWGLRFPVAFAAAAASVALAATLGGLLLRRQADAEAEMTANAQPLAWSARPGEVYLVPFPVAAVVEPPPPSVPIPSNVLVPGLAQADVAPPAVGGAARFDYDLDQGTPMDTDGDIKASY